MEKNYSVFLNNITKNTQQQHSSSSSQQSLITQHTPPDKNHANIPDTINEVIEKTISRTPPAIFLVVNGSCGTNIHTPSHMNIANVESPVSTPITIDVILKQIILAFVHSLNEINYYYFQILLNLICI